MFHVEEQENKTDPVLNSYLLKKCGYVEYSEALRQSTHNFLVDLAVKLVYNL